ncbi:arsenite methyltransferase [Rhodocytophaga rosea]|uniref:Arsenite methyltransferase n=1 Tax=Rhodocytophaga rosea TaxID=2704465 RepID=A0A6C0GJU9_9BACT|nr:arsenite methyltransferase [Rhodocytophaga rosea]QHT68265.1 arsenite methyltransferase [Rhodocytophaga rosea]
MQTSDQLKQIVKEKYSEIALQSKETNQTSCCGSGCCSPTDAIPFAEDYSSLAGYTEEADLGLGCGLPTQFAQIKPGDTVIDLGSGAGNDSFVARAETGAAGKVIGVDITEAMIAKARLNADKLGYNNVEFRLGDIENLPVADNLADVVVSNCVLNLVPDKKRAFSETFRVLKPGGHFSISDVVIKGELPETLKQEAEMYAGCVSGAINKEEYLDIVKETGFVNIQVQKEKLIRLPDETLLNYISGEELKSFKESGTGIYSITLYAEKPQIQFEKTGLQEAETLAADTTCGCDAGCCK